MADFEKASRIKLRFDTTQGVLHVEDLWDLPLKSERGNACLDDIARGLSRTLKEQETESFVDKPPKADESMQLGFDIVKHVIDVRLADRDAKAQAVAKRAQKEKLLELIAKKQDENLSSLSVEELQAQVEAL